ncbi:hypothetical protein PMI42_05959 [Bradyrhizobium sp. YR681]|nr:hypothetical protein PMI42_05959 [Bradyrhizobium sp. YR681]
MSGRSHVATGAKNLAMTMAMPGTTTNKDAQ